MRSGFIPFKPFPFQLERLQQLVGRQSIVWLKRRQIGASWMLAIFAYWVAAYHPAQHVGIVSRGQLEADELMRKIRTVYHLLPNHLKRKFEGKQRLEFESSRSFIQAFPSTEHSGVSYRFALFIADEGALHPYAEQNYAAYRPALDAGGQYVLVSTADPQLGPSGFFYDMWTRTLKGETPYVPIFDGRFCRPDQQEEFFEGAQRNFAGLPDAFDAYYPLTPAHAFIGRTGLVFPQFDPELHVRETDPREWEHYDYRICGIDPGGGDPTAIVMLGVYRDPQTGVLRWHQPTGGEFYRRAPVALDELVEYLSRWPDLTRGYIDIAGGQVLLESLRRYGFPIYGAIEGDTGHLKARGMGLGLMGQLLSGQRLTHHASNTNTIAEYANYRWLDRQDPNSRQTYRTGTPVNNHADAKDAARMAITGFTSVLYRTVSSGGIAGDGSAGLRLVWSNTG